MLFESVITVNTIWIENAFLYNIVYATHSCSFHFIVGVHISETGFLVYCSIQPVFKEYNIIHVVITPGHSFYLMSLALYICVFVCLF